MSLTFFVSKFTVNFELLMELLRLYFPLCYRPVFLFLSNFVCSPSFLLFHLQSFFVYKGPISSQKGRFLREKGVVKKLLEALPLSPLFFPYAQGTWPPEISPARTATEPQVATSNAKVTIFLLQYLL